MTLNISKLLKNIIEKQMKIQHFDAYIKVFLTSEIPEDIVNKITDQFGEEYLNDAKYVIFYRGHIDKKKLKKMFGMTDKALGEDANRLTEGDFKQLKMSDDDEIIQIDNDQENDDTIGDEQQSNDEELENIVNDEKTLDKPDKEDNTDDEKYLPPKMKSKKPKEVNEDDEENNSSTEEQNDQQQQDASNDEDTNADTDEVSDEIDGILNSGNGIQSNIENIPLRFFFLKITLNK